MFLGKERNGLSYLKAKHEIVGLIFEMQDFLPVVTLKL